MNLLHRWFCSSSPWKTTVERSTVPWVLEGFDRGAHVLEVGPGYGATTEVLLTRAQQLTCGKLTVVIRWDEKAGFRTECDVRSQVIDVLKQTPAASS